MKKLLALALVLCCLMGSVSLTAAETPAENTQWPYSTDVPLMIRILWYREVNGKPMDIAATITGTLDDGAEIYPSPTEGEYTSQSGPVALYSHYSDEIELEILRHDAVIDVTVEYGDVMPFDLPSYLDANVEIQIFSDSEYPVAVIAANSDACVYTDSPYLVDVSPFYHRGATGVWYYSFRLDHGVLKSVYE